jgi:methionyl-tRNA formyltransferase
MTLKVAIYAYREWGLQLTSKVFSLFCDHNLTLIQNPKALPQENTNDVSFFLGWSWLVPSSYTKQGLCIALHPSPLPKYRGGSPIQHQIIAGEKTSAVTFFQLTDQVDAGPIVWQKEFPLSGSLSMILSAVTDLGVDGLTYIMGNLNHLEFQPQDESQQTTYKRRSSTMSEITLAEIQSSSAEQIANKIRALQDPYPNAFISMSDGRRIYLTDSWTE